MAFDFREEVLNVELARLLENRGLLSVPETIKKASAGKGHRLPDVTIADLWGLRITIEGKVDTGAGARAAVLKNAQDRVHEGVSPICLAVLYPPDLRSADSAAALRKALSRATLHIRVVSEHDDGEWNDATIDSLAEILKHTYDVIVSEDIVLRSVEDLSMSIEGATVTFAARPATVERLRQLLGIPEDTTLTAPDEDD